jgi:hypothetical protein
MRICSITVRNYRIHRELKVELDRSRTVIGGPNEAGKSTLIEAAHRALFLKARIGGETQRGMVSMVHAGAPEVEVAFEAGGKACAIFKRFSGAATGFARLSEANGSSWQGDEAEARLAEILGVEMLGGGRGAGDRVSQQWAHLWVWQGMAGDDPIAHANAQKDSLLARLQTIGGAAVMQSGLDSRVAAKLSAIRDAAFAQNKAPKKDSDLHRAIDRQQSAEQALDQARQKVQELRQAAMDLEQAEQIIATTKAAIAEIQAQKSSVEEKLRQVAQLRETERIQKIQFETAAADYKKLLNAENQIAEFRRLIEALSSAIEPKRILTTQLKNAHLTAQSRQKQAEHQLQRASACARAARARYELARAEVILIEKRSRKEQISARQQQVQAARTQLQELEQALARLPEITPAALSKLRRLEIDVSNAEAALNAMAAGIEVLSASDPVRIGDKVLSAGELCVISEDAELAIGTECRIRIRPGGGLTLAEARQALHKAREKLAGALEKHGSESVLNAAETAARRESLAAAIKEAQTRVAALGGGAIDQELSEAETAFSAAEGEAQIRAAAAQESPGARTLPEAREWLTELEKELAQVEEQSDACQKAHAAAMKSLEKAWEHLSAHQQEIRKQETELENAQAQCRLLIQEYGADEIRGEKLAASLGTKTTAERALEHTCKTLSSFQPELLESDFKRLMRALEAAVESRNEAGQKQAVARDKLFNDGSSDPQSALALAEAAERSAREHRRMVERKARALLLLHDLFMREQEQLAEQFTQPLMQKISGYLRCIFGPGAQARVRLQQSEFANLEIARPAMLGTSLGFKTLSGGTREQVAAAVRLAMAEVLCEVHDGCLPVVFDDAFVYSDPERVQVLQRMLDYAAGRGLQVIILTCNPADYAGLGARQILLSAPELRIGATAVSEGPLPLAIEVKPSGTGEESPAPAPLDSQNAGPVPGAPDQLLENLRCMGGSAGNLALRQDLGWDEAAYNEVKENLLATGRLLKGRGKGGSVCLPGRKTD